MKKALITCALAAAFAVPAIALAGERTTNTVTISADRTRAYGSLGSARNSSDSLQGIGCFLQGKAVGAIDGGCVARDAAGTSVSCRFLDNPSLTAAVQAMSDGSFVHFSMEGSTCTGILVMNGSGFDFKR